MNDDIVKLVLGDEFDEKLLSVLKLVLKKNDAVVDGQSWSFGGSQELDASTFILGGEKITIERETYVGLSIYGPKKTIFQLREQVNELMNP